MGEKTLGIVGAGRIGKGVAKRCAVFYFGAGIPLMMLLAKWMKLPQDREKMFVLTTMFCNCVFMGYPVMQELFGGIVQSLAVMCITLPVSILLLT